MKGRVPGFTIGLISGWLALFGTVPIVLLLLASFLAQHPERFFDYSPSLSSYLQLLDPAYLAVLVRSLYLAGITTVICLALGYPFSWLSCRLPRRFRLAVLVLLMIPFWTNSLIRTYALRTFLGSQGVLNQVILWLGLADQPIRFMYTDAAVVFGLVNIMLPFMILPLYANLEKFDFRLIEAARDLGAGRTVIFRQIVWPLTLPGVVAGCIMVFVPSMGLFYVAALLGGARSMLVGNLIYQQFLINRNWPLGAALSVILVGVMLALLLLYLLVLRRSAVIGGER